MALAFVSIDFGFMSFLGLFALLIANTSGLEQSMSPSMSSEAPLQQFSAPDQEIKVLPFEIQGPRESFDPVAKAILMKPGEVCKITRNDKISLENVMYRICVV